MAVHTCIIYFNLFIKFTEHKRYGKERITTYKLIKMGLVSVSVISTTKSFLTRKILHNMYCGI